MLDAEDLKPGDLAPDFTLPDKDGKNVRLSEMKGKWVVLYFYPKDNTPGCTREAIDFTAARKELETLGAVVLGMSADSCSSHEKFTSKHNLGITLLADPDHEVIQDYGAWRPKKFMGKEFLGVVRTTVLVDPRGKVAHVWPNVRVNGHVDAVKAKIVELTG